MGTDIPVGARIIADAFDAMTSARSYRLPMAPAEAVQELLRCLGTQFDTDIVDVFVALCQVGQKKGVC